MSIVDSIIRERNDVLNSLGKGILNAKYPNEFELYIIAFELTDENYNTLRYFVFPVNPTSLEESKPQLNNVKKTMAGITALSTPTFVPTDITLSGNFGRQFRLLMGKEFVDIVSTFTEGKLLHANDIRQNEFNKNIKTGYGCIKILESIIKEANEVRSGYRKLIFHNPALGNSYLVKASNLRISQSQDSNMIWNYSLQIKSIAPIESVQTQKKLDSNAVSLSSTSYAQKKVNQVLNSISGLVKKNATKVLG